MPAAFVWKRCQTPQKRKFLIKKRKNQRQFLRESFLNCIWRGKGVLYYGFWPADLSRKKAPRFAANGSKENR